MIKRNFGEMTTLETRSEANESIDKRIRYKQILGILKESPCGMSAKEISVRMMEKGFTPTSERNFSAPRISELMDMGIVEPIGKQTCQYTGKTVTVFRLRGNNE